MWRNRTAVIGAAAALLAGLIGLAAVAAVQSQSNRGLRMANKKTAQALEAETKAKDDRREALGQSEEARSEPRPFSGSSRTTSWRQPDPRDRWVAWG